MSPSNHRGALFWLLAGVSTTLLIFVLVLTNARRTAADSSARQLPQRLVDASSLNQAGNASELLEHVFNKTLGFEKIFVINIPDRHDRRDAMSLAAAYTGLDITYSDGIRLSEEEYAAMQIILPPNLNGPELKAAPLGSWRAHLNVIRRVVEENLSSALIMEDDVDWDLRIHSQMRDFALATRMLVQPVVGTTDQFLDPSHPHPHWGQWPVNFNLESNRTTAPTTSPYGDLDRWEVFWVGHCGCVLPDETSAPTPMGRVVISNDATVPERKHVDVELGSTQITEQYPDHTRVVSRSRHNMCSTAYAISQRGARRLLYEFGVHGLHGAADVLLGSVCDGANDRDLAICYTVQPSLFQHHRPVASVSSFSDISGWEAGFNEKAFTKNIRWSTRLNFPWLANGSSQYMDSFPDGG